MRFKSSTRPTSITRSGPTCAIAWTPHRPQVGAAPQKGYKEMLDAPIVPKRGVGVHVCVYIYI